MDDPDARTRHLLLRPKIRTAQAGRAEPTRTGSGPPARPSGGQADPRRPDHWLDEAIREAEPRGLFCDLEDRGKPLPLEDNSFESAAWRLAHRLL